MKEDKYDLVAALTTEAELIEEIEMKGEPLPENYKERTTLREQEALEGMAFVEREVNQANRPDSTDAQKEQAAFHLDREHRRRASFVWDSVAELSTALNYHEQAEQAKENSKEIWSDGHKITNYETLENRRLAQENGSYAFTPPSASAVSTQRALGASKAMDAIQGMPFVPQEQSIAERERVVNTLGPNVAPRRKPPPVDAPAPLLSMPVDSPQQAMPGTKARTGQSFFADLASRFGIGKGTEAKSEVAGLRNGRTPLTPEQTTPQRPTDNAQANATVRRRPPS